MSPPLGYVQRHPFLLAGVTALIVALVVAGTPYAPVREVPILMYHAIESPPRDPFAISPHAFDTQLQQLKELGYETILPAELAAFQYGEGALPAHPLIITFDDGYQSVKSHAARLLRRRGFRAQVYLVTSKIAETAAQRQKLDGRPCLIWPEIRKLHDKGILGFGSHSHDHVPLDTAADAEQQIAASSEAFHASAGFRADSLAYPFCAFRPALARALERNGYTTAMGCTEEPARTGWRWKGFNLPRFWVTSTAAFPLEDLRAVVERHSSPWLAVPWSTVAARSFAGALIALLVCGLWIPGAAARMMACLDQTAGGRWFAATVIVLVAAAVLGAELARHYTFQTSACDMRLHEDIVRNTWHGKPMYSNLLGGSFLGVHAAFIFMVSAVPYLLWPSATGLLVLQGLCVGAAAWLLWRFARESGIGSGLSLVLAVSLLLYRGTLSSMFSDFHQEVLAIFFLIGFFWAEHGRRWPSAALFAVLALLCREDVALPLAVYGALRACDRRFRVPGLVLAGAAACWFCFTVLWLIPHFAVRGQMYGLSRWAAYGSSAPEIALGMLRNIGTILPTLFTPGVVRLFSALLFLPLFDLKTVLPLLLPLLICTTSSAPEQVQLNGAYSALFVAYLFAGTVRVLSRPAMLRACAAPRVALCITLGLAWSNVRQVPWPATAAFRSASETHQALTQLHYENERVLAQASILPQLGWPKQADFISGDTHQPYETYDQILLSETLSPFPMGRQELRELAERLRRSGKWEEEQFGTIRRFRRRP